MGKSDDFEPRTTNQLVHLIEQRGQTAQGTPTWINLQSKIDEIVAQNYLHFVNR